MCKTNPFLQSMEEVIKSFQKHPEIAEKNFKEWLDQQQF